ncbi:hypothetical protein KY285_016910 [Solanum tuberosum]|nr:hypothetical protein KY289_017108 [Solanum tuberosum]KAH0702632.1 hypothetical protein KY285_016910 [Solanum tuberosum]
MKLLSPKIKQKGYVRRICVVSEEGKVDVKEVMVHSYKDDLLRLTVKNPISSSSLKKYVTWVEGPSESVSLPSQKGRGKVGTHYPPHTPTCGTTLVWESNLVPPCCILKMSSIHFSTFWGPV